MISDWFPDISHIPMPDPKLALTALGIVVLGLLVGDIISRLVFKASSHIASVHHSMLFRKTAFYLIVGGFVFYAMERVGMNPKGLWGALGLSTIAVAYAANNALTNVASGICLLGEKPFEVGDYIRIDGPQGWDGQVLSIDLLSVKLRTRDNVMVRMPNDLLIKSELRNLTRFPIRRVDVRFRVAFDADVPLIKKILFEAAKNNPLSLETPAPEWFFVEFGEGGVLMQFSVWSKQSAFIDLQTSIQNEIQNEFRKANIKLPMLYFQPEYGLGHKGNAHL